MKTSLAILLTLAVAVPVTWLATRKFHPSGPSSPATSGQPVNAGRKLLYYQSAMHPWIKSGKPGRCTLCGMELTPVFEGDAGFDATGGGDVVPLTQTMIQVINVQTTEAQVRPLKKTLQVAGIIDDDATRHRILTAYTPGRVQKLHVNFMGAEVTEGQPLVEFYSPTLLQSEREYRTLSGELRAATALRLLQMGLTAAQIEALPQKAGDQLTSQILAPIGGTVVAQTVYEGQYVQEGERLFEIADFSTMWFQFRAYEQDLPWIKLGLKVDIATPSRPGKTFTGQITFIDPNFEEATRSTKVRVELANPVVEGRRFLLHRLYADGWVHLEAPEVLTVPRTAVIETGPEAVAYVDQGSGTYSRRVLRLGRRGDALVEVAAGLSAGNKVVVNGNLLIDGQAEMNRTFAEPIAAPAATNGPASTLPAMTSAQRTAVQKLFTLADAVTTALADDNLAEFNQHAVKLHLAMPALLDRFLGADKLWDPFLRNIEDASHFEKAGDLLTARQTFYGFSRAEVALAQVLRRTDKAFATLKVFRCPMTKNVFPGAPATAEWIQLKPLMSNPYMGVRMQDCGTEVP